MVGEIRDSETAQIAVRAANSGHMVLATLHAPVAASAIKNMLFFDVSAHFLSDCLLGVVSQRLYRRLCNHCKVRYDVDASRVQQAPSDESFDGEFAPCFYGPKGCAECNGEGYVGRDALVELLTVNSKVRRLIADAANPEDVQRAAVENGMIHFQQGAQKKIAEGITSPEEIMRVVSADHLGLEI